MEQIAQKSILEIAKSMEELLIYTRTAVFAEEERKRLHIAIHSIKGLLSEDEKRQMKNAILLLTKISAEEPVSKEEVKPFLYDCIAYAEQKTKNLRREPEHFLPAISSEEQQNHEKKALLALRIFDYCTAKSELTFLYESARERNREVLQKAIEALENYDYSEAEEMISQLSGNKNTSV